MEASATEAEAASLKTLAEVSTILEPVGLQEETELQSEIMAEFVMDSRKKDKLLCNQLQVLDFLQGFLVHEDTAQGLDPLASEDLSRQKAIEAKEQWKQLKATYQEHVEAIASAMTQALPQMEEAHRKRAQLQEALEQLQAKKQVAKEKLREAQKQWQLQQEKHLQHVAEVKDRQRGTQQEVERLYQELRNLKNQERQEKDNLQRHQDFLQLLYTLQNKSLLPETETELQPLQQLPLCLDLPEDKPPKLTRPQKQNMGDNMGGDRGVTPQVIEGKDEWPGRRGQARS